MVTETKNTLTRSLITEELMKQQMAREKLSGKPYDLSEKALTMEQVKIRTYINTIKNLEVMHNDELAKIEKAGDT